MLRSVFSIFIPFPASALPLQSPLCTSRQLDQAQAQEEEADGEGRYDCRRDLLEGRVLHQPMERQEYSGLMGGLRPSNSLPDSVAVELEKGEWSRVERRAHLTCQCQLPRPKN
jgi:hypothetical protein